MISNGWTAFSKSTKKYDSDGVLRVRPDSKLKVRLIDNPVKLVKIFTTNDRKCINLNNEEAGRKLKAKYPDMLDNVSVRYACWCINREDNSLKILDMPVSVARGFGNRASMIGKKISDTDEGCDWKIMDNGKKGKDVRYEVVYIEETPLSEAEQQLVEDKKASDEGLFDLTQIFKSCSYNEAEEKLLNG